MCALLSVCCVLTCARVASCADEFGEMTVIEPPVSNGKPRLVIKRLELENFKSYAGVQHVGPFHKVSGCCVALVVQLATTREHQ